MSLSIDREYVIVLQKRKKKKNIIRLKTKSLNHILIMFCSLYVCLSISGSNAGQGGYHLGCLLTSWAGNQSKIYKSNK